MPNSLISDDAQSLTCFDDEEYILEQAVISDCSNKSELKSTALNAVQSNDEKKTKKKTKKCLSSSLPSKLKETYTSDHDWGFLNLSRPIIKALFSNGFNNPTPIQNLTIPYALEGRDILATAQTGSGKTIAFLVPILERLYMFKGVQSRRQVSGIITGGTVAIKVIILLPTRELAFQCTEVLKSLSQYLCITHVLIMGGVDARVQEATFRQKPDIIIATPGRLLDHLLNSPSIHFDLIDIVILDEADRLVDLGFRDECLRIIKYASEGGRPQTMLFSATLSEAVRNLALLSLVQPLFLDTNACVATGNQLNFTLPSGLQHSFILLRQRNSEARDEFTIRQAGLLHFCCKRYKAERILVFFRTKQQVHHTSVLFSILKIPHVQYHGNLTQAQRLEAYHKFLNDQSMRIMLCSELASRGLDLPNLHIVINTAVPPEVSRYIHQSGRTARIFTQGKVITFYMQSERSVLKPILKVINKHGATEEQIVTRLKMSAETLNPWLDQIKKLAPEIKAQLNQDKFEKSIRVTEMNIDKVTNCIKYDKDIKLRPKKKWLFTEKTQQDNKNNNLSKPTKQPLERKKKSNHSKREQSRSRTKNEPSNNHIPASVKQQKVASLFGRKAKQSLKPKRVAASNTSFRAAKRTKIKR